MPGSALLNAFRFARKRLWMIAHSELKSIWAFV